MNCVVSVSPNKDTVYTNGIVGLADGDLEQIAQAVSDCADVTPETMKLWVSGYDRHIAVGDIIVRMIDDVPYAFRLMGFNHYALTSPLAYSEATRTGKAGLLFQMAVGCPKRYSVAPRSRLCFTWSESSLRKTCGTLYKHLTEETQSVVKEVRIPVASGDEEPSVVWDDSRLFLPSEREVFGCSVFAKADEGTQYAWYAAHGSDENRVKTRDGCEEWWWTRSPCEQLDLTRSPDFCRVSKTGTADSANPAYVGIVAPCFCV